MQLHSLMDSAAKPAIEVVRNIRPEQLGAPTPCAEYDVRRLLNHLLYWGPALDGTAADEPRSAEGEREADLTRDDWATATTAQVARLAEVWSRPESWQGTANLAGAEMPAGMLGGMVLCELVLHAWDLARATGARLDVPDAVAEAVREVLAGMAEYGRQMGAFGPEVAVPESAPALDRALGLAGRDPAWTP